MEFFFYTKCKQPFNGIFILHYENRGTWLSKTYFMVYSILIKSMYKYPPRAFTVYVA